MARIRQVRERDGTLSPYRERKVAEAIHQALRESGSDDRALADELAGVVSLFLERTHVQPDAPPLVVEIQDTIERVLSETGNDAAARRFQKVRRLREQLREQITVRANPRRGDHEFRLADEIGGDLEITKWSRTRLVRSLTESAELPAALAEEVAASVEAKVFGLELQSVSSDLIRHLVECELFERGIHTEDRAGERIPISTRSLLGDLFGGETRAAPDVVAGPVLAHFALSELHGDEVARAHAEGLLHVHGLDNPLAIERLALPMALVPGGGRAGRGLLDLRRALDAIRPHVASVIELVDVVPWLLAEVPDPAHAAVDLVDVATSLDVNGRAAGPAVEIHVPLGAKGGAADPAALDAFTARLVALLRDGRSGAVRVRFVHRESASASKEVLALAFDLLRSDPTAAIDLAETPAPAADPSQLRVSLARVTLNLPLLLLNRGGEGLKEALAGLDRGARLALAAFHERAWVQRKGAASGLPGIVGFLGGQGQVSVPANGQEADLEVWGLNHALELLVARGAIARPGVPEAAARLLGHLHYHLGEERDGLRFVVTTGGCASRAVRKRLLAACEANARKLGAADLLAELKNERATEGVVPLAVPLSDRRNRALVTSRIFARLGPGLGIPEACITGGLSADALAEVRRDSAIRTLRLSPPGAGGLFEVQEELFG